MKQHRFMHRWAAILLLCVLGAPAFAAGVSDEELKSIAIKAQDAIRAEKVDDFSALWNNPEAGDRITRNVQASPEIKAGFLKGTGEIGKTLGDAMMKGLGKNGSYTFLGIKTIDDERRPILRLISDQGMNFHELIIERDATGTARIVDMYIVLSGESIVQTERRLYLMLANMGQKTKKLEPNLDAVVTISEKMQKGDFQGVLDTYDAAPEKIKRDRVASLLRVMAAQRAGKDELYYSALEDYAKLHKEEATADLLSIDLLFNKKDFDGAMKTLDSLEKKMGTDGGIDFYRANLKGVAGDAKAALEYAQKAVDEDPTLFNAADFCLTTALKNGDFASSKKYLLVIENNRPNFKFGDLKGAALFKEFVKSPEYAAWQKERPRK
jgi:tetratricopeptide (TPR) repeat protein